MTLKEFAIEIPALRDEAKALWGESTIHLSLAGLHEDDVPMWKYRLQQMVTSDDPVKHPKDHSGKEV